MYQALQEDTFLGFTLGISEVRIRAFAEGRDLVAILGPCWAYMGPMLGHVRTIWDWGQLCGYVGQSRDNVEPVWDLCWAYVGLCWALIGPC